MGQPSKVETHGPLIIEAIATGKAAYLKTAARLAGVHPGSVNRWIARADDHQPTNPADHTIAQLRSMAKTAGIPATGTKTDLAARLDESDPYCAFRDAYQKARAESESRYLGQIETIGTGLTVISHTTIYKKDGTEIVTVKYAPPQWQAFAWLLERTRPDDYSRQYQPPQEEGPGMTAEQVAADGELVLKVLEGGKQEATG